MTKKKKLTFGLCVTSVEDPKLRLCNIAQPAVDDIKLVTVVDEVKTVDCLYASS